MTDRYSTLTVVLECDLRDDDAQQLIDAIGTMRRVASVSGNVEDRAVYAARERVAREWFAKLHETLNELRYGKKR